MVDEPIECTGQPTAVGRIFNLAFSAMFPHPNFLTHKAAVEEVCECALCFLKQLVVRHFVEGENIDINAVMNGQMVEILLDKHSVIKSHFSEVERCMSISFIPLQKESWLEFDWGDFEKSTIILSRETHVDVVVPWYNFLPKKSTDCRATQDKVGNFVFITYAFNFRQNAVETFV